MEYNKSLTGHFDGGFFGAQNALEVASLPKLAAERSLPAKAGALLERSYKPGQVGVWVDSLDQEVEMVGHEAVRNYGEVFVSRRSQKLPEDEIHGPAGLEHWMASLRTNREEIPIAAGVVKFA